MLWFDDGNTLDGIKDCTYEGAHDGIHDRSPDYAFDGNDNSYTYICKHHDHDKGRDHDDSGCMTNAQNSDGHRAVKDSSLEMFDDAECKGPTAKIAQGSERDF